MSYRVPAGRQRSVLEIKRSRFITTVSKVSDKDSANEFLAELKKEFPDANHHCWAHILDNPASPFGYDQSDDGEPKGTAGKPMLNVLQHSGLGQTMVIVTRYFGGIKLGAGGLVRAYSNSVSEALKQLSTYQHLEKEQLKLNLPYSILDTFKHYLKDIRVEILQEDYSDSIDLCIEYPEDDKNEILKLIDELGQSKINIIKR